ncbi:methyltransferase domain-containing protein [Kitasatospora indigofera]|uniref:methyltransferase domain-containing protein n=1 Tax=Kitasatospora indigofera TaxID=67307 RepID=UPI0036CB18DC
MTPTAGAPAAARPWIDDPFSEAIRTGRGPLWLRTADGRRHRLDVERWCAPPDAADRSLLERCAGLGRPALDVGCGPGRLVAGLLALGLPALGVDLTVAAVARTRRLGGPALCRSVFERLPAEGRWGSALLADGNLGIGGDPAALLGRIAQLLRPGGRLFVEVEPREVDERLTVRIEDAAGHRGPPFRWARLGAAATAGLSAGAGLVETERWSVLGRHFLALTRLPEDPGRCVRPRGPAAGPAGPGAPGARY